MGILEKISEIEKEIARTQKNKATEYHLGLLKAKLAKYRSQLLEPSKKGEKGEGFDVLKSGDARVALIGFPSVGKSTLLSTLTKTESEAANYEFTTLTCIPGVIEYKGANIQLLDLPGIIEGAAQGKGRGRQVIAVARTADLVVMMLDATKPNVHRDLLEKELESVGIRLNKRKPNIYYKVKKGGGISFNSTCTLTKCSEKLVQMILHSYKIFNAEVLFREDCTEDEFIDVISANRVYLPCLYVYNKIDQISIEEVNRLAREDHSVVVSCNMHLNLDYLLETVWDYLQLIRVYTKKPGAPPDFDDGLILRKGVTVEHVCHAIHRTLASQFKYALAWGVSTKYSPQRVGISHIMADEDVIQDPSFTEDGIDGHNENSKGKKGSMWHRVKWTDKMVKLLITAVSYIGDDIASDLDGGGRRKCQIIQKKGKWKLISKVIAERGYQVSPQQCEDKFNDLNKRYKRLNDIIGRGTSCQVVENPALLDVIDYLTDKEKDDVRKILNSKQLFYEEMCSYHNSNRLHLPHDPALQRSLQLAFRAREDHDNDEPRRHQNDDFDENENGETDEHDDFEENFVPHVDNRRSLGVLGGSVKRLKRGQDHEDAAHACGNSLSPLDCNKSFHAHSQAQFGQADIAHLETESIKASTSQKQWMELRLLQLEEQKLQIQVEMLELEKQKFKWDRFNKKKDRELEKMRMVNERMKLENERIALDLKQKQIGPGFH